MTGSHLIHDDARTGIRDCGRNSHDLRTETGWNLNVRLDADRIPISPSDIPSERGEPADVPVVDMDGTAVAGEIVPSTEPPMHLAVNEERDSVGHAHSLYAKAFAASGESIPISHHLRSVAGPEVPLAKPQAHATRSTGSVASTTTTGSTTGTGR